MSKVTIFFMPAELRREFVFLEENKVAGLIARYKRGAFVEKKELEFPLPARASDSQAIAVECFDLTNDPSRQVEREEKYGKGRSVSVGDIVRVHDKTHMGFFHDWLCMSFGWKKI